MNINRMKKYSTEEERHQLLIQQFEEDRKKYKMQCGVSKQFRLRGGDEYPFLEDFCANNGLIDYHYFIQDIYVAKKIFQEGIKHVYDIGSRVDGFISHLLSMGIRVTMLDIRPFQWEVEGIDYIHADATALETVSDASLGTLTSLHALEHFGLGRYGDDVDYLGWKKGIAAMKRVLTEGGKLYLSVPVGKEEKVMFNAHRIFHPTTIINECGPELVLEEFSVVHNNLQLETYICRQFVNESVIEFMEHHVIGPYDCGIFVFKKKSRNNAVKE